MTQQKTTPQQLTLSELKKIKGGFRETPGIIRDSITVRWDEITIRVRDRDSGMSGRMAGSGATRPNGDQQEMMP